MPSFPKTTLQILTAVFLTAGLITSAPAAGARTATVRIDQLNLRTAPDPKSPVLDTLERGDRFEVLAVEGRWLKTAIDGKVGFVFNEADYVDLPMPAEPQAQTAEDAPEADIDTLHQKAAGIQKEIAARQQSLERFNREEVETVHRLDALDRKIDARRRDVRKLRQDTAALDQAIADQAAVLADLKNRIAQNRHNVERRLVALYKLGQIGPLHVLASARSIQEMLMRQRALERILFRDAEERQEMLRNQIEARTAADTLNDRKAEKAALEKTLAAHLAALDTERNRRGRLLAEIRGRKTLELAAVADLKSSAEALDQMITELKKKARARRLEAGEFVLLKGLLEMPVSGKVINFYGPYRNTRYNVTNFRSGIDIQTDRGEPIRAVAPGTILFADWFKGYGNMIILDHGNNYYTLYAHIEELFKAKGDRVERGEVIATVGDSASLTGPGLYFEVRHHGKPENPMQWLKQG